MSYKPEPVLGYHHERPLSCGSPGVPPVCLQTTQLGASAWYKHWVFLSSYYLSPSGPLWLIIFKRRHKKTSLNIHISFTLISCCLCTVYHRHPLPLVLVSSYNFSLALWHIHQSYYGPLASALYVSLPVLQWIISKFTILYFSFWKTLSLCPLPPNPVGEL